MTSSKDSWTRAALSDDVIVVELLLRLKKSRAATSTSSSSLLQSCFTAKSLLLRWGMRLPRSKAAAATTACKDESTRFSPTTPLSWTQSTNTADGLEESSHLRSKGSAAYESTSTTTNGIKKRRKKKVYDELKEEETSLLDERTSLRKEIATLQTTFKEQRAQNDNFKRAKLDLSLQSSATSLFAYSDGAENANAIQAHLPPSFTHFPSHLLSHVTPYIHPYPQLDSCDEHKPLSSSGNNSFVLPDLNMAPSEDDSGNSETLWDVS